MPAHPPGHFSPHPTSVSTVGTAAGQARSVGTVTVDVLTHIGRMQLSQTDVVDVIVGQPAGGVVVVEALGGGTSAS